MLIAKKLGGALSAPTRKIASPHMQCKSELNNMQINNKRCNKIPKKTSG